MIPEQGLTAADFDAFAPEKWSSNAFNLERLEVKLKLTSMGKQLNAELREQLSDQEMGLTEERPSIFNQHQVDSMTLFFFRGPDARRQLSRIIDRTKSIADHVQDPAPHHKHIALCFRVDASGAEFGLCLHRDAWIDWKNAEARCRDYGEPEKLSMILADLPESIGFGQGERLEEEVPKARDLGWENVIDGLSQSTPWTIFGQRIPRSDPLLGSDELVDRVSDAFKSVSALHDFIAWRPDSDFQGLKVKIKEHQEKAQRKFKELQVGDKVRILQGLARGRIGVVDSVEKNNVVKVRLGLLVMSLKFDDLVRP